MGARPKRDLKSGPRRVTSTWPHGGARVGIGSESSERKAGRGVGPGWGTSVVNRTENPTPGEEVNITAH